MSTLHSYKIIALQKPLKVSPQKSQVLSCDTVVANERYVRTNQYGFPVFYIIPFTVSVVQSSGVSREGRVARLPWWGGRGDTDHEAAKLAAI